MRMRALMRDEKGVSAVEYGLILSFIVLAMLAGLKNLATASIGQWNDVSDNLTSATR